MPTAVKHLIKIALPALLFIFSSFCFSRSADKTPSASKPDSPVSASSAQPQAKSEKAKPEKGETSPGREGTIFKGIVAKIDGKPIYGRELESIVRRELAAIGNPEWNNLREDYRGNLTYQAMTLLINSKLIYQKAVSAKIEATPAEVEEELKRISKTYPSDAEMNATLATQLMDRASLKESLHESLTVQKYLNETIEKKIAVTDKEMADYYAAHPDQFDHDDLVRISQIIMAAGETAAQDALVKERAEAILARVKKGEDFAKLAKENSIDGSAANGGDIEYHAKEDLVPGFAEAAFSLNVGESKLIKIRSTYVILKVTDKKKKGLSALEEVKPQLSEFLKEGKVREETANLINQLKDQSPPEYLIPYKRLNP
jgi:peptidyl-prolyl cis-trans isomerase C